jgi:spermidine synthase
VGQLLLNIDSAAGTVITNFDGRLEPLDYLKHDVTAVAHFLRQPTSVLVIGVGGGRDILTSLVFRQKRVVGVEINADILRVLTEHFGDYAGHLERHSAVTLINDEARSYVARSPERFGIIQASLIDTWAATSAGAYVLTDNGLYTKEAWTTFLNHLTPDGILTMSRWHDMAHPSESLRLVALATATLKEMGVSEPRRHVMMVRRQDDGYTSVATILVSPSPFTDADVARLAEASREMHFLPVLTPNFAELRDFESITTPGKYEDAVANYPVNIAAPTDDSPFFFHMLRPADLLKGATVSGSNETNLRAVRVLATLLAIVVALSASLAVIPLIAQKRVRQAYSGRQIVYFAAIGLAFMMVEIAQLERLIVFLGHPMYGLTVVLFVLLVASSLGSLSARRMAAWIWLLPVVLTLFILISPTLIRHFVSAPTFWRIALSALLLFPSGFFMGMPFPIGIMTVRASNSGAPAAWYWGINGAFSVISSVLAVVIAMFWGITASLLVGLSAYIIALFALKTGTPATAA